MRIAPDNPANQVPVVGDAHSTHIRLAHSQSSRAFLSVENKLLKKDFGFRVRLGGRDEWPRLFRQKLVPLTLETEFAGQARPPVSVYGLSKIIPVANRQNSLPLSRRGMRLHS